MAEQTQSKKITILGLESFAIQLLALLPMAVIYGNWHTVGPLVTPVVSDPLLVAAVAKQIAITPAFAIFSAVLCATYFLLRWRRTTEPLTERLATALCLGLIAQMLVLTRCWQFPFALDDPFIDFRYVHNWSTFHSFDYNIGERIQGYSSALHLALLFILNKILPVNNIAGISTLFNTFLQIFNLLLIFAITTKALQSRFLALLAALVYCLCASGALTATDNKESALLQLLMLAAIYTRTFDLYHKWCALLSVLISLTRPEGILWFAREFISDTVARGKACLSAWGTSILLLGFWYGFVAYYYGTVIPHGALGRASMFHSAPQMTAHACPFILTMIGMDTFKDFFIYLPWLGADQASAINLLLLVQGAVALVLLLYFARKEDWLRPYANNCALLLLFFAAFDPWLFSWYYSWFSLIAVFLIPLVVRTGWRSVKAPNIWTRAAGLATLAAIVLPQVIDLNLFNRLTHNNAEKLTVKEFFVSSINSRFFVLNAPMERLALYQRAADFMAKSQLNKQKPFATLATWEPGVLGYYLPDTRIIDLGGLVSDEALQYYPVPVGKRSRRSVWGSMPDQAVIDLQPDRVIFFDSFADNGLLKNQKFLESYRLLQFWPLKLWGGQGLFLFEKI